ncbi:GNAT family N-acetyltransferase [Fusobacterium sp.]|uniref:GNAT family N-acetyltransferase n=1 Tax=Fusobacterium sp. TaxID=68766 RepID=UPI0029034EBE|nr:GNAT family N-acetyltransferase [Fusobacterium sp.]MDU1909611.1 GNAT family N-acetyltransferase [Fusobacterium sp.]
MEFRRATLEDIELLIDLRKKQLIDEGIRITQNIDYELDGFFRNFLGNNTMIEWLVESNSIVIASAAVIFYDFPPTYTNISGKKAYITNMYTSPEYRGKGIATSLLNRLVKDIQQAGIEKVWLGASKLGRPVYKKFGFKETDEWLEITI